MRVAMLGLGRLGGSVLSLLGAAGVDAVGWSRGQAVPPADVYWLTVRDAAVHQVAALLPADAIALHASGALPAEALGARLRAGVLHPLMTFPGAHVAIPALTGVPARVGGHPSALEAARSLALSLGMRPFELPAGQEVRYHAACNLASGHLAGAFLSAARTLEEAGLAAADARQILLPLALKSLENVAARGAEAITGTVARGDAAMMARHREVVADPSVYDALAEAIGVSRAREGR
jgi:predicted short-subunit dehydrogenase-like oxidoreductase (DUF2520 family)